MTQFPLLPTQLPVSPTAERNVHVFFCTGALRNNHQDRNGDEGNDMSKQERRYGRAWGGEGETGLNLLITHYLGQILRY